MPLEEPVFWYGRKNASPAYAALLRPVAGIYGWVAARRMRRQPSYTAIHPVVCVGNFTAGGTGKTPLTRLIAQSLVAMGYEPVVLTRGYGGRISGPHIVDPIRDLARDVGDEPLLLARTATVCVARDRIAGAQSLAARGETTVIVMDDGLQTPGLHKDLRIAVADGKRGFGNGRVIPAGPLRAPIEDQFAHVDAIVVNMGATTSSGRPEETEAAPTVRDWLRSHFPGPVLTATVAPDETALDLAGQQVLAYAGIANPRRFSTLLERIGASVVETCFFRDHEPFTAAQAENLLERARQTGARLVTTEKDFVRLPQRPTGDAALIELARASTVVPIHLEMNAQDADRLRALLETALQRKHAAG